MTRAEYQWIQAQPDRCRVWHRVYGWLDTPGGSNCQACWFAAKHWNRPLHIMLHECEVSIIPKSEEECRLYWRHYFDDAEPPEMEDGKWQKKSSSS